MLNSWLSNDWPAKSLLEVTQIEPHAFLLRTPCILTWLMFTPRQHSFKLYFYHLPVFSLRDLIFRYFGIEAFFSFAFPPRTLGPWKHYCAGTFFFSTLGKALQKRFLCFSVVFHAFSFCLWSYQELVSVALLRFPWLTHEVSTSHNVFSRGFPHETRSPAAML